MVSWSSASFSSPYMRAPAPQWAPGPAYGYQQSASPAQAPRPPPGQAFVTRPAPSGFTAAWFPNSGASHHVTPHGGNI